MRRYLQGFREGFAGLATGWTHAQGPLHPESVSYDRGRALGERAAEAFSRGRDPTAPVVPPPPEREGGCLWCGQYLEDRSAEAGVPKGSPAAWATTDGDYGCDHSPETCAQGVGAHARPSDAARYLLAAAEAYRRAERLRAWARRFPPLRILPAVRSAERVAGTFLGRQ